MDAIFGVQKDPSENLPEKLYIVSFPGLERSNVLLHVNFGHEIGHQIQDEFFSSEEPSYLVSIQREVEEELKNQYADEVVRSAKAADTEISRQLESAHWKN